MKRVLVFLAFLVCINFNAFSDGGEVYLAGILLDEHRPYRTQSNGGTLPLVEFYNDGVTPVVYVDVVPSSSSVLVFIINLDTMEEFYDIAEAGDTAIDIDITGTQGRYEVFYSADGEVPTGYANIGYAGNFNIW